MPSLRLTGTKPELNAIITRLKENCHLELIQTSKYYESAKLAKEFRVYIEVAVLPSPADLLLSASATSSSPSPTLSTASAHSPASAVTRKLTLKSSTPSQLPPPPSASPQPSVALVQNSPSAETAAVSHVVTVPHPIHIEQASTTLTGVKRKNHDAAEPSAVSKNEKKAKDDADSIDASSPQNGTHTASTSSPSTAQSLSSISPHLRTDSLRAKRGGGVTNRRGGRTSYTVWSQARRAEVLKDGAPVTSTLQKQLREEWKDLPPETKRIWEEKAEAEREARVLAAAGSSSSGAE